MVKNLIFFILFIVITGPVEAEVIIDEKGPLFQCPETGFSLFSPEGPVKSGTMLFDTQDNSAYTNCSYEKDAYQIHFYWRKKEGAVQGKESQRCHNDHVLNSAEGDRTDWIDTIVGYYSREAFGYIDFTVKEGGFFVEYVEPYSPAFESGLKKGEKLISLDGKTVSADMKPEDVSRLVYLKEEAGEPAVLKIQSADNAEQRDVRLEAARFDPTGEQIWVYSKTHWARAEILLDPQVSITKEIKDAWIKTAQSVLRRIEPEALTCKP